MVYFMNGIKLLGHPSVGDLIIKLAQKDNQKDKKTAARLYSLIKWLELDPTGKTITNINVCPVRTLSQREYKLIRHKIMRGKLIPWEDSDISTHFRIIYFFDTEVGENVYLYLAYYFWNSDPGWKDIVLKGT